MAAEPAPAPVGSPLNINRVERCRGRSCPSARRPAASSAPPGLIPPASIPNVGAAAAPVAPAARDKGLLNKLFGTI